MVCLDMLDRMPWRDLRDEMAKGEAGILGMRYDYDVMTGRCWDTSMATARLRMMSPRAAHKRSADLSFVEAVLVNSTALAFVRLREMVRGGQKRHEVNDV